MIFDVDKFFADSFPVLLSADISMEEGENKQMDSQALSNYFDTPMVIDEIRVQLLSPVIESGMEIGNFGGSVRLKLTMGRYALTDTYVPVACFGPTFDGGTIDNAVYRAGVFSPESTLTIFTPWRTIGFFRWKLPRPLLVPSGMPLEAKISRQIEGLSQVFPDDDSALSVNLAYVGRVSKKRLPRGITVPVPYVGLFSNVFASANVVTSNQLDLYNPFKSPLTVQRFIARWQNIYWDTLGPTFSHISLDSRGSIGSTPIDFPLTQIRTFSGFNITNGFIPGPAVWEANTRSLGAASVILTRGEGFEVTIDATAGVPPTSGEESEVDGSNTSFVTMIGWRNEDL